VGPESASCRPSTYRGRRRAFCKETAAASDLPDVMWARLGDCKPLSVWRGPARGRYPVLEEGKLGHVLPFILQFNDYYYYYYYYYFLSEFLNYCYYHYHYLLAAAATTPTGCTSQGHSMEGLGNATP
jgi:hypothetical protein